MPARLSLGQGGAAGGARGGQNWLRAAATPIDFLYTYLGHSLLGTAPGTSSCTSWNGALEIRLRAGRDYLVLDPASGLKTFLGPDEMGEDEAVVSAGQACRRCVALCDASWLAGLMYDHRR